MHYEMFGFTQQYYQHRFITVNMSILIAFESQGTFCLFDFSLICMDKNFCQCVDDGLGSCTYLN